MTAPLLEARSIHKSFAGIRALKGVDFDLRAGEVHALVGENGAGKSTLIKIITGALTADSGTLRVAHREVAGNNPALARSLGIAAIYQQPSLFPHLTVAENIAWTLESGGMWRRLDWKERHRQAAELVSRAGASIDPTRPAATLSMSEQQIVEIAKAIGAGARILIMDEPTASLTDREVESLFQVITSLRAQGSGVIYISHRLNEIFAIADRITVLRDGESVSTKLAKEIDPAGLIELMAGRPLASVFPKREVQIGEVALELRHISCGAVGIRDISLSVRAGEILGLAGLVGSGRTELAETIFGLHAAESGETLVQNSQVRIASPVDAMAAGVGYVPEDRRRHGVVLDMPISANISLASLGTISRWGWIDPARERILAERYVTQLQIKTPSVHADCGTLSGGNQQKVALARWLAIAPKILILDEPTQGIDVAARAEIHRLMGDLAERGIAIIMISSELPEILGMSDRIAVMHNGSLSAILPRAEATQQKILTLALGHNPIGQLAWRQE
jgi:rhamnose transport system ATP-binding protein